MLLVDMVDTYENADSPIVLEKVTGDVLTKIIEYCEHHQNDSLVDNGKDDIVDTDMLCKILLAAKNMDIKPLLDLSCKTVANTIRGKSPEEICILFNVADEFTDEKCEQIRQDNEWAKARKQD
ncbi:hypothetical protein GGH96_002787 [Coemansia sp. RSA 1972]|nr:hypothetical protein GGH96_002787 [Coemansia sp. RSA 1972]